MVFAWQWMDGVFGSGSKLFWELKNEVVLLESSFIFSSSSSSSSSSSFSSFFLWKIHVTFRIHSSF